MTETHVFLWSSCLFLGPYLCGEIILWCFVSEFYWILSLFEDKYLLLGDESSQAIFSYSPVRFPLIYIKKKTNKKQKQNQQPQLFYNF